jgi:hypothetical protein
MTTRLRLAALAALAILGACRSKSPPVVSAALALPSAVAVFRGVTTAHGADQNLPNPYHPYIAVANAHTDDIALFDAVDDTLIGAPIPLHGLVYPVPGRPALLAAADLGDQLPDLLVAVSSGDSKLQLVRTWAPDGALQTNADVDFGADAAIVAILALSPDPAAKGTARIVAALAGGRIGVASYARSSAEGGLAIARTSFVTSAPLGFQPVDIAVIPGELTRIWAATPDAIGAGVHGVAEINVTAGTTPALIAAHDTIAPTRLVATASLMERVPGSTALDQSAFTGQPTIKRVYAVLDESGCGFFATIACGLVALDLGTGGLAMDPVLPGTIQAPIPLVPPVGLAASPPPVQPPDSAEPFYGGTYLRIVTNISTRATTAAAGVASTDGGLTFVDLGRWEVPSQQAIVPNVKATVTPVAAPGVAANQFLVLTNAGGTVVSHGDPAGLTASVGVTPGFTPTDRWTVTYQGVLPGLTSRRAEAGTDAGGPWLAMQATGAAGISEVVRLFDPVVGVHPEDIVVFDPNTIGTCPAFEATVTGLIPPDAARPGGAVQLGQRTPANPAWNQCLGLITGSLSNLRATIRAGGYVLVRGATGAPQQVVGRPELDARFDVASTNEAPLTAACLLPPAVAWPGIPVPAGCGDPALPCRAACDDLIKARLARRISYLSEPTAAYTGPAISFTLALETPPATVPPSRDLALIMDTAEGRLQFRTFPTVGSAVGAAAVVPFDRSPYGPGQGIRFFVPYSSGVMIDATPTLPAAEVVNTLH